MNIKPIAWLKTCLSRCKQWLLPKPKNTTQLIEWLQQLPDLTQLDNDAIDMIKGVLKVSDMQVRDVMVPRSQMVVLEHDQLPHNVLPTIIESTHSRFPVVRESRDEIVGILLAKDLLPQKLTSATKTTIETLARPAVIVPESKRLDVLLKEFRLNRNHMAIVVDEYGGVSGLITIEDVLEQIVGNIEDEYDVTDQEPDIKPIGDQEFAVKALTTIEDFNQYFGTNISDEDFDTVGGYVVQHFGHLPKRGEVIEIHPFKITVVLANKRRIQLLNLQQTVHDEN